MKSSSMPDMRILHGVGNRGMQGLIVCDLSVMTDTALISISNAQDQHVQLESAVQFLGSVANAAASSSLQQPQAGLSEQQQQVSAGLKQLLSQVLGPTFQQPRLLVLQVNSSSLAHPGDLRVNLRCAPKHCKNLTT